MLEFDKKYRKALQEYAFIDLFAGIGGFRYAMESFGANCVFTSEWDKFAQECYSENFGDLPDGDITKVHEKDIPKHNFICAGFPCQAFSVSGNRLGFEDTRGTLFFDVARIARYHNPEILLLENVRNFEKHDNGKTVDIVLQTLEKIGYNSFYKVINSSLFGIPQRRERIYFVCFQKKLKVRNFYFPSHVESYPVLKDILDPKVPSKTFLERDDINIYKSPIIEKDLLGRYPQKPLQIGKVNKGGQGERIYSEYGHAVTQAATTGGPGGSTGLYYVDGKVRRLTPKESSRVQGFPESFIPHEKSRQAKKQIGNSVAINVLQMILKNIINLEALK